MKYLSNTVCCLLLFSAPGLHAQHLREIEFSVYSQYPVHGIEFNPVADNAIARGVPAAPSVTIKTHIQSRMGPHKFTGENDLIFLDASTKATIGKVRFGPDSNKWLLIFVRNPRHKKDAEKHLKYLIYAFDDSEQNLPTNHLVFLNISGKTLDGLVGSKRVQLAAGESSSYQVQKSLPLNLWTQDFSDKKLLPALIKTYSLKADHRYLLIFFPPVLRGSVDLDTRLLTDSTQSMQ